jgi:hypothetical protein
MKTFYRIAPFCILIVTSLFCSSFTVIEPNFNSDYENDSKAEKVMSKEFSYNSNTSLDVNNSYGNVKVTTWKSDKVKVDAYVRYDASISDTKAYASKSFKINISQNGNEIKVSTQHLRNNIKHTISYVIYAPSSIKTKIAVRYGDIALGDISGYVNVNLKYGDLFAEKLSFGNNKQANNIVAAYGDVAIKEVTWLNLTIDYGNFALQNGYAIGLNGAYSDFKIDRIKFVNSALSYSDLKFGSINSIKGRLINTDMKIDKLSENMVLSLLYSNVIVYSIDDGFSNIDLQGNYSDGKLTFQNNASFKLNVMSKYSDFKLYNLLNGVQNIEGSFSKTIGNNPSKNVKIVCNYGDWTLRKN